MKTVFLILSAACARLTAQDTLPGLKISAFIETYYCYDFAQPPGHARPGYFYNYSRHNEVNLNVGYLAASYEQDAVRGRLALMAGSYAATNLAGEGPFQSILEASAGFRPLKRCQLWVEAGVFPSHIGFESAAGSDNWTLTRSLLAENSPYYETGVRLSGKSTNNKVYLAALVLNGWQRIRRHAQEELPAFGTQLTVDPTPNFTFNWSTFAGKVLQDSILRWRFFNNLYVSWRFHERWGLQAGYDLGFQQEKEMDGDYEVWNSPVLILRHQVARRWRAALRAEYYDDPDEVIIRTSRGRGFQVFGYSANVDYLAGDHLQVRAEVRRLQARDNILFHSSGLSDANTFITLSFLADLR